MQARCSLQQQAQLNLPQTPCNSIGALWSLFGLLKEPCSLGFDHHTSFSGLFVLASLRRPATKQLMQERGDESKQRTLPVAKWLGITAARFRRCCNQHLQADIAGIQRSLVLKVFEKSGSVETGRLRPSRFGCLSGQHPALAAASQGLCWNPSLPNPNNKPATWEPKSPRLHKVPRRSRWFMSASVPGWA